MVMSASESVTAKLAGADLKMLLNIVKLNMNNEKLKRVLTRKAVGC